MVRVTLQLAEFGCSAHLVASKDCILRPKKILEFLFQKNFLPTIQAEEVSVAPDFPFLEIASEKCSVAIMSKLSRKTINLLLNLSMCGLCCGMVLPKRT